MRGVQSRRYAMGGKSGVIQARSLAKFSLQAWREAVTDEMSARVCCRVYSIGLKSLRTEPYTSGRSEAIAVDVRDSFLSS